MKALRKMKFQLRYIDLVTVVALTIAGLALILSLLLISNNLNQPSTDQQSVSQQNMQVLQDNINSLKGIQTQVNNSLFKLEAQWKKSSKDIVANTQSQYDTLLEELQALRQTQNSSARKINSLQTKQRSLSQEIEVYKSESTNITQNFRYLIDTRISAFRENVSLTEIELNKLADSIRTINDSITRNDGGGPTNNCSQRGTISSPVRSCRELCVGSPDRMYWIQTSSFSSPFQAYCDLSPRSCSCSREGWMRAASFDMTRSAQQCPSGFKLITRTSAPRRTCGRPDNSGGGCVNTTFPVNGVEYSRVCGRIVAYQLGTPSGFRFGDGTIDGHYLAGISLTHGQIRQHIWSFVNAKNEGSTTEVCPCIQGSQDEAPSFIGQDYFCDTAVSGTSTSDGTFYPNDPLWDGQGCGIRSTCCSFNSPPWFCKQLPRPTTDDIELRLCENSGPDDDDSPFEIVELYVS